MTQLAYYNDPKIKQTYLDQMKAHAAADELLTDAPVSTEPPKKEQNQ